jgi:fructose-1,6-bisphosphatase
MLGEWPAFMRSTNRRRRSFSLRFRLSAVAKFRRILAPSALER